MVQYSNVIPTERRMSIKLDVGVVHRLSVVYILIFYIIIDLNIMDCII